MKEEEVAPLEVFDGTIQVCELHAFQECKPSPVLDGAERSSHGSQELWAVGSGTHKVRPSVHTAMTFSSLYIDMKA